MMAVMMAPATISSMPLLTEARKVRSSCSSAKELIDEDIMFKPQNSIPKPDMICPIFLPLSPLATEEMTIPSPAKAEKIVLRLTKSDSNRPRATI